ncbi:MAG: class I SAM-dependent methyltransferase, partial [Candidatus Omnitrophica bacterium]|nr:class I SAM-dependent methyltransferase [Candidatus Omnitrophota bacterium]
LTLPPSVKLVCADFHKLPFCDGVFDLVVSAFVLRSVEDLHAFLGEIHRVLTRNGKAALLCLTRPKNLLIKCVYLRYLWFYVPVMGRLISGHAEAYRFLSESIGTFQDSKRTADMMKHAGFSRVERHEFSLGIATLIMGQK